MATGYNGDISLVPQFLRGYRGWLLSRYNDSEYQLRAVTHRKYVWVPGQQVAECAKSVDHGKTPEPTCECGFYASYTSVGYSEHVKGYLDPHSNWGTTALALVLIHGAIRATGRVVMGTRGFRAERAEPEAFCLTPIGGGESFVPGSAAVLAQEVLEPFGVPLFSSMEALEDAFPASDVSELIPISEPIGDVDDWSRGAYVARDHRRYSNHLLNQLVTEVHGVNCWAYRCSECRAELEQRIKEEFERREASLRLMEKHRIVYLDGDWPSLGRAPMRDAKGRWTL